MYIMQDKDINALNCMGEGILAVLSSLIQATEKKKKEIVLFKLKKEDKAKEIRLLPLFV